LIKIFTSILYMGYYEFHLFPADEIPKSNDGNRQQDSGPDGK